MVFLLGNPQPWSDLHPTPRQLRLAYIGPDVTRRYPEYYAF